MNTITITYLNESDFRCVDVMVFTQNNVQSAFKARSTAWQVIKHIGQGSGRIIKYPLNTDVQVWWDTSSFSPVQSANLGEKFTIQADNNDGANACPGYILAPTGPSNDSNEIAVANQVHQEQGVDVKLFKDGRLLMVKEKMAFNTEAQFVLKPSLIFGVVSDITEGDTLDSDVMQEDFTKISLEGVESLTVTLKGNEMTGPRFERSNVVLRAY